MKRVEFLNPSKEKLVGSFVDAQSGRSVILCHGFGSFRDGFQYPLLANKLKGKGLSSLRFDFSGNGDSQGKFEFGNYAKEVEDLRSAATHLKNMGEELVAVIGHSKGGNVVLLYAAKYDDIPAVVNVSGRFDLSKGITERFGDDVLNLLEEKGSTMQKTRRSDGKVIQYQLTKWSMQERLKTNMKEACSGIRHSEVLTIHGSKDDVIPVADAKEFQKCIGTHTLHIVEGADHMYKDPKHAEAMVKHVLDFIL